MKIKVNSKEHETSSVNIAQLVAELGFGEKKIAVAKDSKMIPRDQWEATSLTENSNIMIIKAVCGG